MIKMKNVPLSLSFRCLNSSFYPFVGPIPWLYHTLQRFLLLNILSLLLSSILPADTDLGKNFHLQTFYGTLSNHHFYSLRSKRFRAVSEQRTRNESQRSPENGASKWVWQSFHFSRAAKPENPVPRPFSAPKPNGHVFYASYDFYPDLGSDTSSVWNFCARFSDVISWGNQWWRHEMLTFTQSNEKRLLRFRET